MQVASRSLQTVLTPFDRNGPFTAERGEPVVLTLGRDFFPDLEPVDTRLRLAVHITLPRPRASDAPGGKALATVVILNCFAFGLERCEWYFDYADRLATWNYAVVQFERARGGRLAGMSPGVVKYAVDCVLAWATSRAAGRNPQPRFRADVINDAALAFVGHSKGGADAAHLLAHVTRAPHVRATAFMMDAVDYADASGRRALEDAAGRGARVAMVKAQAESAFNPRDRVDGLLSGALAFADGHVLPAVVKDAGHFSFVDPRHARVLRRLAAFVRAHLDTCRPYRTPIASASAAGASDEVGVFNQCAAMAVAWLHGIFCPEQGSDQVWQALFATSWDAHLV